MAVLNGNILKEFCVSYYQQVSLFILSYLSTHSDFAFMTSYIQVLHILKHIFPLRIDGILQCSLL